MKCTSCGYENIEEANFCSNCNQPFEPSSEAVKPSEQSTAPVVSPVSAPYSAPVKSPASPGAVSSSVAPTAPSAPASYNSAPQYNSATARPAQYPYQQPYYYQPVIQRPKQQFTITDAYIIIGFVLAVVGIFAYAFILLPAGIGFSIIGFVKRTNARTLGLSIAGIVVGVVACLIKIGMVLNELGVIPDWLSAGIF